MFKVLDILFPKFCLGCNKEGQYICEECQNFLGEASLICPICEKSSFTGERHENCSARYVLDGLTSVWEYEGIIKQLIHQVKYRGISHALSEAVASAFETMLRDEIRFEPFFQFLSLPDVYISYVPMFRKKEKQRGFNQAHLIAQEISKIVEKPVLNLLEKTKDTASQTDLSREERLENVKGSFSLLREQGLGNELFESWGLGAVSPEVEDRGAKRGLDEKSLFTKPDIAILLIDDIWTTGATMRECCKVLKKAGVENVWGFTLARTV